MTRPRACAFCQHPATHVGTDTNGHALYVCGRHVVGDDRPMTSRKG